jgi:hypothetical protein
MIVWPRVWASWSGRVVETLEKILLSQEMQFSEAAFFQVKENLQIAHEELRQQIHLAH